MNTILRPILSSFKKDDNTGLRPVIIKQGSDWVDVAVSQGEYVKVKCFLIDSIWSLQRHLSVVICKFPKQRQ